MIAREVDARRRHQGGQRGESAAAQPAAFADYPGWARAHERAQSEQTAVAKHVALTWMQRLKRVFTIDIETCAGCGGRLKVIASIEDPVVIGRILEHLEGGEPAPSPFAPRAPPQRELPV